MKHLNYKIDKNLKDIKNIHIQVLVRFRWNYDDPTLGYNYHLLALAFLHSGLRRDFVKANVINALLNQ